MDLWDEVFNCLESAVTKSTADSWRKSTEVDRYLLCLCEALPKAQLLIERSECWRLYKTIDELLSQLKDSVYEAEDIADELQYQILKNKVEKSFPGIDSLRNWMIDFPTTVKRVLDRLNKVYDELKEVCDSRGIPENPNQFGQTDKLITGTFLDTYNVYGRDNELNKVIHLMGIPSSGSVQRKRVNRMSVSSETECIGQSTSRLKMKQNVSVLSIVGMGGIGKTTLAQMAYNDKSVRSYFDLLMWVCVPHNFDSVWFTKEIIESVTKRECNLTNLDALQVTLQKTLKSKRFLLVLDDVWTKDWQRLLLPMNEASQGSVVLVTTRSRECLQLQGTSIGSRGVIDLEGLEKDIYWKFFKTCAFDLVAKSNNINPELEVIGKEICDKLNGSPLLAKTIGGVLRTNLEVTHWTNIKNNKMWLLQEDQHDILPVLKLSYQYLPSHLKKCFLFCSLYPEGFKFTQSELTVFWIMQDLIKPLGNLQQLRTLAEGYSLDLVRRCFFQKCAHGTLYEYVIHDLMRDVCRSITKDGLFCLENEHSEQEVSPDIRHVSDFRKKLGMEAQNGLSKYKKMLSLKVDYTNSCHSTAIESWCNELTNIRSLSLARCKIKMLPENIGNLKHLRFLDISCTYVGTLPESLCRLYNLRYLNMFDCSYIKCFPKGFNNLVNLLLLCLPLEKVSLLDHSENIFNAIQLCDQTVRLRDQKIEILKNIRKLSGSLTICDLENVSSKEAAEAKLYTKPLINHLDLVWSSSHGRSGDLSNKHHDEEVLNGLCPHHDLRKLRIAYYGGTDLSPSWLKEEFLPNLEEVLFEECEKVSFISHLPRSITKLSIVGCTQLINLQNCLEPNHLPVLKQIQIIHCMELKSLPVESFGGFEFLEWLAIKFCPKLESPNAMVLPPSVKGLELRSCGDLEKSIPSCLQNLTSLEMLSISDNQGLISLPAEVTNNLKSLSELHFEGCTKLQSLGGLQFLASLQKVTIRSCPMLNETRGRDIIGKLPSELLKDVPLSSQMYEKDKIKGHKINR